MKRPLLWLLVGLGVGLYFLTSCPSGVPAVGADATVDWRAEPRQGATDREPFRIDDFQIHPRATFEIDGVVAASKRYFLDGFSALSPIDVVMTWGDLPTPEWHDAISYNQGGRFYLWVTRSRALDLAYIKDHSANMHLVPATANLAKAVKRLDRGDAVRIRGLLIDAHRDDGRRFKTSLTRTDDGAGGCEVIWVEELVADGELYR